MSIYEQLKQALGGIVRELIAGGSLLIIVLIRGYFARVRVEKPDLMGPGSLVLQTTIKESDMQVVAVTMDVPKEGKEVIDALAGLVADFKAKKPVAEVVAGNLGKLLAAIEGFDQLGEEAKSSNKDELAGYSVQQIMHALGV